MTVEEIKDYAKMDRLAEQAGGYVVPIPEEDRNYDWRAAAKLVGETGRPLTDAEFESFRL